MADYLLDRIETSKEPRSQADGRISVDRGMYDWAARVFTCLYGKIGRPVGREFARVKGAVCERQVGRRVGGRRSTTRTPHECPTDQRASRRAFIKSGANHSSLMPRYPGHMAELGPIMTGDEWAAAAIDNPPTPDDVTITLDGRRIDSKEKAIAWLAEIEADRADGKTAADPFA